MEAEDRVGGWLRIGSFATSGNAQFEKHLEFWGVPSAEARAEIDSGLSSQSIYRDVILSCARKRMGRADFTGLTVVCTRLAVISRGSPAGAGKAGHRMMAGVMMRLGSSLLAVLLVGGVARAETCTTQSQMPAADRSALADAARGLAAKVQADDVSGVQAAAAPEYAQSFSGIGGVVNSTAAKVKGGVPVVTQVYLLDGSSMKPGANGAAADAQFFCTLNKTETEADFLIPGLLPGKYGFAIVDVKGGVEPWRLSFLLKQEQGRWTMAGFYPKPMTAAGHDGVWYWSQARTMTAAKERLSAWLYYQQAADLLDPAGFVQSTNLEKLRAEESSAAPPTLSDGVSADAPLVVKGPDGVEYHFIALGVDDSLSKSKIDVTAHLKVDQMGDPEAAKKRNSDAMVALVTAYPEMRKAFEGVWIFAEAPGQNPFITEQRMTDIH